MSDAKKKFTDAKNKAIQLMKERPLETIVVASMAVTAAAKLINSATEARNSSTWKKEVERRERKERREYYR